MFVLIKPSDQHQRLLIHYPVQFANSFRSIVANEQGSFTTPSFVSFTDKERLIGESAKNQAAMNPQNTIFDIKFELAIFRYQFEC